MVDAPGPGSSCDAVQDAVANVTAEGSANVTAEGSAQHSSLEAYINVERSRPKSNQGVRPVAPLPPLIVSTSKQQDRALPLTPPPISALRRARLRRAHRRSAAGLDHRPAPVLIARTSCRRSSDADPQGGSQSPNAEPQGGSQSPDADLQGGSKSPDADPQDLWESSQVGPLSCISEFGAQVDPSGNGIEPNVTCACWRHAKRSWGITFSEGCAAGRMPLTISHILPDGLAETAGVRVGDVLLEVDGHPIVSFQQAIELLGGNSGTLGHNFTLGLFREGGQYGAPPPRVEAGGTYELQTLDGCCWLWHDEVLIYRAPNGSVWTPDGCFISGPGDTRAHIKAGSLRTAAEVSEEMSV